jgi:uncharacterized protein YndB with AHSA1/START domain
MAMQRTIETDLDAPPESVFGTLAELDRYRDWLDLVHSVQPAPPVDGEPGPAWLVTLRAAIGPLARSKRLRMVRRVAEAPSSLRFERAETDGRAHAPWTLDVQIAPLDGGARSQVTVSLAYGGGLWSAPLDAVLGSHLDRAVPRLADHVRGA